MQKLKSWSPKTLQDKYLNVVEAKGKETEAIYRLGTSLEMESVWQDLLSKPTREHYSKEYLEKVLVFSICDVAKKAYTNTEQKRPSDKNKEITKIQTTITKLINEIKLSTEAKNLGAFSIETTLTEQNKPITDLSIQDALISYRNQLDKAKELYKVGYPHRTTQTIREVHKLILETYGNHYYDKVAKISTAILDKTIETNAVQKNV